MMELFDKQVQLRMGQANVKAWIDEIMPLLADDSDPRNRNLCHPPHPHRPGARGLRDVPTQAGRRNQDRDQALATVPIRGSSMFCRAAGVLLDDPESLRLLDDGFRFGKVMARLREEQRLNRSALVRPPPGRRRSDRCSARAALADDGHCLGSAGERRDDSLDPSAARFVLGLSSLTISAAFPSFSTTVYR
jgi:hypothetical protein